MSSPNQLEPTPKSSIITELSNQRIQLELLFSTGAVVSLLHLPDWISKELTLLSEKSDMLFRTFFKLSEVFILAGINALIIGFVLNIFFRVLTLCYLGVDYVFPKGIITEKLNFSDFAKSKFLKSTNTESLIERSERLAGFSFSFSILLVFKLLGSGFVFCFILFLLDILGLFMVKLSFNLDNFFYLVLLIVLGVFDYIVFVLLRRFNWLSKIYYPIYLFFNFISLNFLTRKQKLILNSHFGRFATGFLVVLFLIMGILLSRKDVFARLDKRDFGQLDDQMKYAFFTGFYDDERAEEATVQFISIPSRYVSQNQLPIFCNYPAWYDYDLEKFYTPKVNQDSLQSIDDESTMRLKALGNYLTISINDSTFQQLKWLYFTHPKTGQKGILTHVPIKYLEEGQHRIGLKINVQEGNKYVQKFKSNWIFVNFVKIDGN